MLSTALLCATLDESQGLFDSVCGLDVTEEAGLSTATYHHASTSRLVCQAKSHVEPYNAEKNYGTRLRANTSDG